MSDRGENGEELEADVTEAHAESGSSADAPASDPSRTPAPMASTGSAAGRSKAARKDRLRPVELIGFSAILAVFTGVVVIVATREPLLAVIGFGVAFIIGLVGLAMFSLAFHTEEPSPDGEFKTRLR